MDGVKTKMIVLMIVGVLLVIGGMVYANEGRRGGLEHEIFIIDYSHRPGLIFYRYHFRLTEDAVVSLEGHNNIRELFPPLNMFAADTLEDIKAFVEPELIMRITPIFEERREFIQPMPEAVVVSLEDVSEDDWFFPHVTHGFRFGILRGERGESFYFKPERAITQAEFITMLGRMHEYGNGAIRMPGGSTDYERYINWAVGAGIISEGEKNDFMPYDILTREQLAVIIDRYLEAFELEPYFAGRGAFTMQELRDIISVSYGNRDAAQRIHDNALLPLDPYGYSTERRLMPRNDTTRAVALELLIRIGFAVYDSIHLRLG